MTVSFVGHGVPPCWRAYFLLLRQKKVAKEKATPGSAPATPVPCATRHWRGLRNSGYALRQSSPLFRQRLRCSAPLMGTRKTSRNQATVPRIDFHGQPEKTPKNEIHRSLVDALPGPLRGAEQRRKAGGSRRGLFEGQSPEFRSRPAFRVAQGTGAAGTDPGSPFLCLLSFGEAKESETPRKGGTPRLSMRNCPKQRQQDA